MGAEVPKHPPNLPSKFLYTVSCIRNGVCKPTPSDLKEVYYQKPSRALLENPPAPEMVNHLISIAEERGLKGNQGALYTLLASRFVLSKSSLLATLGSFSDQTKKPCSELLNPPLAKHFVDRVVQYSENEGPATISDQFNIALEATNNRVLDAVLVAYSGSRAIARSQDNCVDSKNRLTFTCKEMESWHSSIAGFENINPDFNDSPGDNYHLWGGVAAGLSSKVVIHHRDYVLNPIYSAIHQNTGRLTSALRYNTVKHEGRTHEQADRLGFNIGTALHGYITSK